MSEFEKSMLLVLLKSQLQIELTGLKVLQNEGGRLIDYNVYNARIEEIRRQINILEGK